MKSRLSFLSSALEAPPRLQIEGRVSAVLGSLIHSHLPDAAIGELCFIKRRDGGELPAQVVAFSDSGTQLAPLGPLAGITPGAVIRTTGEAPLLEIQSDSHGVYDCLGRPMKCETSYSSDTGARKREEATFPALQKDTSTPIARCILPIDSPAPNPLERPGITRVMSTGVRAIDLCCPIGYGQRIGLFAGPGVGKSTLLGMIARAAEVDRIVIALVGERGREVAEFIEQCLGEEGRKRSVVFVSTSDEPPVRRKLAAISATRMAEYYRDRGERVLLMVDSLTRTARAVRDVSLSAGELPVRQGYTSSVYEELPRLVERAGTNRLGSITAIYTVLTSYDDNFDALSEEVKSLLDGHILLSRERAERGIFPAIDLPSSVSRLIGALLTPEELKIARMAVRVLSRIKKDKDIALLGGKPDKELALCLALEHRLENFFRQGTEPLPSQRTTDIRELQAILQPVLENLS